jgi:hypothetical protein
MHGDTAQNNLLHLLWCGKAGFRFDAHIIIGTKSIRLGVTMLALFLKNHCSERIMILSQWLYKVFLDYIRPKPGLGVDQQQYVI